MVTTTRPEIITNDSFIAIFGEGDIAGVPVPIIWTLLAVIAGILLLHYSVFGRQIYAAGGNPTAALYSGINIRRVTTLAFVLTGALAGLAALVLSARSHAARPDVVQGHGTRRDRFGDARRLQSVRRTRLRARHAARQSHHRHAQ